MPFSEIEYTRKLGTWCDGIPLLHVADLNRTAFTIKGVGHFPHELSPFGLGFYYKNRRDFKTTKITLQFGMLDHFGELSTFAMNKDPGIIHSQRPRQLRDWAVAVELTPQT